MGAINAIWADYTEPARTMMIAPQPPDEAARLASLQALAILDTPPEQAYEDAVQLATQLCETPIALVTLIDTDRQWFKARVGLTVAQTHRDLAFCAHAILEPRDVLLVPDTTTDRRFCQNPLVKGNPGIRFYAGVPLFAPDGLPVGTLCVIDTRPRTLTKQQQDGLTSLARLVEQQFSLRKKAKELTDARKEADRANRAKNYFLAAMSQEIRTPLNGVVGMCELLALTQLSEQQSEYAATALSSGKVLLNLVNDVLDVSTIEADDFSLDEEDFCPRALMSATLKSVAGPAKAKGLDLQFHLDEPVPAHVKGDLVRIQQILLNLIENALKFTARGSVRIHLAFEPDASGFLLKASVTDTGIGTSDETQLGLFQPFTQADPSIARRFGGAGLGLAICRRLTERMGGTIGLESEAGVGSRFFFTLRLQPSHPPVVASPPESPTHASRRSLNVLLVDDNPVNIRVGERMLNVLGHRVVSASSGREAIAQLEQTPFDVVLMDLHMPGLNGVETTQAVRGSTSRGADVWIIASTADADPMAATACRMHGMNDVVPKPLTLEKLAAALRRAKITQTDASVPTVPAGCEDPFFSAMISGSAAFAGTA